MVGNCMGGGIWRGGWNCGISPAVPNGDPSPDPITIIPGAGSMVCIDPMVIIPYPDRYYGQQLMDLLEIMDRSHQRSICPFAQW